MVGAAIPVFDKNAWLITTKSQFKWTDIVLARPEKSIFTAFESDEFFWSKFYDSLAFVFVSSSQHLQLLLCSLDCLVVSNIACLIPFKPAGTELGQMSTMELESINSELIIIIVCSTFFSSVLN